MERQTKTIWRFGASLQVYTIAARNLHSMLCTAAFVDLLGSIWGREPDDCTQVTTLQCLLQAPAVIERSKLYETIFGNQKKDSVKALRIA
jgi:hypothetical protein